MNQVKKSIQFIRVFVSAHCATTFFSEEMIRELRWHVESVNENFVAEDQLFEKLYNCFSPDDLLNGQNSVPGYVELELLLNKICTTVRIANLPRVH